MRQTHDETAPQPALPLMYHDLTPLSHTRHADLGVAPARDFAAMKHQTFAPLTMDEFAQAQRCYPIVFSEGETTVAVALLGGRSGRNAFVTEDGAWRKGAYTPGYLRRYPFQMVRETAGTDRHILCADMTSPQLERDCEAPDRRLFDGATPTKTAERVIDFCKHYEQAMTRTRAAIAELKDLDLIVASSVAVQGADKTSRIDGFSIVSEERLRALSDETLAGLARRGVLGCVYAHLFSLGKFAEVEV